MWLSTAAVVAGFGIWATHFVAMLAFGQNIPIGYDVGLTALSVAIAVGMTWIGFALSLRGGRFAMGGGAVAGAAIGAMHFVGMEAIHLPATLAWDHGYVMASVVIGVSFGAAALHAASSTGVGHRAASVLLLTLAIVSLHFTAMAAVTVTLDPTVPIPVEIIEPEWMAIAIAAVTILIVGLGLVGSIVDQHLADRSAQEAARLRAHVTELEATRSELEETAAHLTRALEAAAAGSQAKSQFLATISHELRTPLNAVIGFSDLMATETFGPLGDARYRDYVRIISDSGAHLLGLINDVLDISKLDAGGLQLDDETVALPDLIDDALRMLARQAEKAGVTMERSREPGLPPVRADQRRVRQVVLNLLSNALKFTPAGGHVRISAKRRESGIMATISDDGIGIAPHDIPRALERFGQVDDSLGRKYEGTGLGLPLSKRLMELHGGTLDLASELGKGTTVTIAFPAARVIDERQAAA